MTRRRARLAAVILMLTVVSAAGTALAQTSDGFDPSGWEYTDGVAVTDDGLVISPDNAAFRPQPWGADSMTLRISYQGDGVGLIVFGGAHLIITPEGGLVLEGDGDGEPVNLGESTGPVLTSGTLASLAISAADGRITIEVDDTQALSAEAEGVALANGGIVIEAGGGRTITIDSISGAGSPGAEPEPGPEPESEPGLPDNTEPTLPAGETNTETSTSSLLDDFFSINAANVDVGEFTINLALAGLLSFILSRVYIHWGTALSNRRRFATNFMLIAVTTTFIILVVRSSVALSLGLVGALSIVRFRAAIKDPEELAYMFLAIGIGIGLGDNQRLITIIALAAAVVIIMLVKVFHRRQEDFNLHVTVAAEGPLDLGAVTSTLAPHCAAMRLSRYDEAPERTEAVFLAEFETSGDLMAMRDSLREIVPGATVSFLDDKGVW